MKLLKNLEAVFLITATFAVSTSYVMADPVDAPAAPQAAVAAVPGMQVVVVSAKRMTAAEKQQSLRDDPTLALRAAQPRRS